jgi:L-amino acid N-acyltransferase YncA
VTLLRAATAADVPALTAIYNEGIAGREATFETSPRAPADVAGWLEEGLPFVVAQGPAGELEGFARVSAYSDRCVYEGVGEHGVYVAAAAQGRGIGRALLDELCATAERAGYYKLTSRVFTSNAASRAVHRAAGFEEVGVQRRHGRLDGAWRDCVLVERLLGEAAAA